MLVFLKPFEVLSKCVVRDKFESSHFVCYQSRTEIDFVFDDLLFEMEFFPGHSMEFVLLQCLHDQSGTEFGFSEKNGFFWNEFWGCNTGQKTFFEIVLFLLWGQKSNLVDFAKIWMPRDTFSPLRALLSAVAWAPPRLSAISTLLSFLPAVFSWWISEFIVDLQRR